MTIRSMVYFDNAATTKPSREALDTYMNASLLYWANPSSLHSEGVKARKMLGECRSALADLLSVKAGELTFTSSATESDSIVLQSLLWAQKSGEILMSAIEHDALSGYGRLLRQKGWTVVNVDAPKGFVRVDDVRERLTERTRLVTLMLVNNVLGTIQDVKGVVKAVREEERKTGRKIHVHCDATQALGKIPFSLTDLDVDSAAFSAHKLHGPKGVGLLYNRNPSLLALSRGGGQEAGLRPGTENLSGIMSMEVAIREALAHREENGRKAKRMTSIIREALEKNPHILFLTPRENSSPFILNLTNDLYPSEVLTRMLYDRSFCVSSGSACSSNARQHRQRILFSMGFSPRQAAGSVRLSFSRDNTEEEAHAFVRAMTDILEGRQS